MDGTMTYWKRDAENGFKELRLTVMSEGEKEQSGLSALRRRMLMRILSEARNQGARLTYSDLSVIMLSSRATLKRDVGYLRSLGHEVPVGRDSQVVKG